MRRIRRFFARLPLRAISYTIVILAVAAGLTLPPIHLTRTIDRALENQVATMAWNLQSLLEQAQINQPPQPSAQPIPSSSMLEDVGKATVKIEVKLKYEVARLTYNPRNRPSLQDLAEGRFWPAESYTLSNRWLRLLGSGFVIYSGPDKTFEYDYRRAPQTLILTNYHIVEQQKYLFTWQLVLGKDARGYTTWDVVEAWRLQEIQIVGFFGGDEFVGIPLLVLGGSLHNSDVAASATLDLAVLATARPTDGVPVLNKWADPATLKIGQPIYLVGYPLGNSGPSVAKGIISVLKQNFGGSAEGWDSEWVWNNLLQYDAAQTPGNSGSVIISEGGEIIGIARGSDVQIVQILQPEPENPLWYDPKTGKPLPPILPPWLRIHDKPTDKLQWVDVAIPWEGMHYGVRGEAVMKWLRLMGLGFVLRP